MIKTIDLSSGKKLLIRTFLPSDYPEVKQNLQEADMFDEYRDSLESLSLMSGECADSVLVAVIDNRIAGSVYAFHVGFWVYIFRLNVRKQFQNQGIATELLNTAEEVLKSKGFRQVALWYRDAEEHLGEFYEKRGWVKAKRKHQWMSKKL